MALVGRTFERNRAVPDKIGVNKETIAEFCRKWHVAEFSFFGSVLRDDFGPESDVDVLISLAPTAECDLFDWMDMRSELETLLGRPVDLVEKAALRNPYRRAEILSGSELVYAA